MRFIGHARHGARKSLNPSLALPLADPAAAQQAPPLRQKVALIIPGGCVQKRPVLFIYLSHSVIYIAAGCTDIIAAVNKSEKYFQKIKNPIVSRANSPLTYAALHPCSSTWHQQFITRQAGGRVNLR